MSLTFHFLVYSFSVFQCLILACRQCCSHLEICLFPVSKWTLSNFDQHEDQTSISKFKKKNSAVRADGDRTLFARLAVVAQSRSLNMRSVLHCELGPVPWSLATPDGGLVKTDKSCLLHFLESGTQPVEDVPPMAALILDGMAVLQTTRPTGDTFSHLADQVFRYATQGLISGGRVDFVVDRYLPLSIKSSERERRAAAGMLRGKLNQPDQWLPNWKKFLAVSDNKIALNHDWFFLHPMDLTTVCQKVAQLQALSLPWKLLQCPDKHQWSNSVVDGCSWAGMPPRRGWHAPFLACTARCFFQICCCYHTLSWHWRCCDRLAKAAHLLLRFLHRFCFTLAQRSVAGTLACHL